MRIISLARIVFFCLLFFGSIPAHAEDVNFTLYQEIFNDNIIIRIENIAKQGLFVKRVELDFDHKRYAHSVQDSIPGNQTREYPFKISFPSAIGTHPLVATLVYLNDGREFTLRNLITYNFMESVPPGIEGSAEDIHIVEEGKIVIKSNNPEPWRLVLPEEIEVIGSQTLEDQKIFTIRSHVRGVSNRYQYYAVAENTSGNRHSTAVCSGTLIADGVHASKRRNGRIPPFILLFATMVFFFSACFMCRGAIQHRSRVTTALLKYSSRMFLISLSYLLLQNFDDWIAAFASYADWKPLTFIADRVVADFRGINFISFFHYFADFFYFSSLLLFYPYLYHYEYDTDIEKDKYASLMISIRSVMLFPKTRKVYWTPESRLGGLTFLVKFFFLPIMTTWVIDYTFRQINLTKSFYWNFAYVNAYLVALFFWIDTAIFCFGYLFESGKLKNEIKSVEPTVLGWLVCLWCYPPFNSFSWIAFDHPIIDIQHNYPMWVLAAGTVAITVLWGIYAWASVTLGFKASNLTNRGIVGHGPYRYVRHPAYAAKLAIWWVQGLLFGQFLLGNLLAHVAIYALRAWTEERHLSKDADYLEYRKKVRHRFIPGMM